MSDATFPSWVQGLALSPWLIEFTVVPTLLPVTLCCVAFLARNTSASIRHAIWASGLISLLLVPFGLAVLPRAHLLPPTFTGASNQRGSSLLAGRQAIKAVATNSLAQNDSRRADWISSDTDAPLSDAASEVVHHPVFERGRAPSVVSGKTLELKVQTKCPRLVRGQVLTADVREPVAGALVVLNCLNSPMRSYATTDAAGRFQVRVAPGTVLQQVVSMGHDKAFYERYEYPRFDRLNVAESGTTLELPPFLLPLKTGVFGRVQASDGSPIAGVSIIHQFKDSDRILADAISDDDGRFKILVRNWKLIREDKRISDNHRWAILNEKRIVNGRQALLTTPLRIIELEGNRIILERVTESR